MCLICGGPHYTGYCPNSPGDSNYDLSNSFLQPQPYHNSYPPPYQSYNEFENPSFVQPLIDSYQSVKQTPEMLMERLKQHEDQHVDPFCGSFCGPHRSEDRISSLLMENIQTIQRIQEVADQMLRQLKNQHEDPMCEGCGEPHKHEDCPAASRRPVPMIWDDEWDLNQGDAVEIEGQGMKVVEDPARGPELPYEESETKMDISVPPPIQQKAQEEKDQENPHFIIDCTWDDDLIDQKLAEWKKSKGTDEETERKKSEEEFPDEEKPRFIIDFTCNDEEIDQKLAEWKKLQTVDDEAEEEELEEEISDNPELSAVESETTTDNSVPPPVQQDPTLNWYSTPYSYGPEPIDDDFWSEDEGGVVEKMELEMFDYTTSPVDEESEEETPVEGEAEEEHPVDSKLSEQETIMDDSVPPPPIDENFLRNGDEKEEEENEEPSWETEFGDELVNLPIPADEEVFDPVGDLAELEALMEGKPTMEIKESPKEEVEEVVEEEEHHSWPVVMVENETYSVPKLRERAKRNREPGGKRHLKRHVEITKQKKKSLTCTRESSHYMHLIKFAPGKFDYWWPDPFKKLKSYLKSTKVNLLKTILDRAELNGLDRVQIKEKPPDEI